MFNTKPRCSECNRLFDLTYDIDIEEWHYGHDCEEEMPTEYWDYVHEFRKLRRLPDDANVRDEASTRDNGPLTPAERMDVIEDIFALEQWDFPWHLIEDEEA